MYYPRLGVKEPENHLISVLSDQVAELLRDGYSFATALNSVVSERYGGRFFYLKSKVARALQARSNCVRQQKAAHQLVHFQKPVTATNRPVPKESEQLLLHFEA